MQPADDLLYGVQDIARFLGVSERQVYRFREAKQAVPIRKQASIGIYAFKSELIDWLTHPSTLSAAEIGH
jgi:predicted transcriptional regulator